MKAFILVKPLDDAKCRLSSIMSGASRRALAAAMLEDLLTQCAAALSLASVTVVSADPEVARIAARHGAGALFEGAPKGMNTAATLALAEARRGPGTGLMLLPADLPWVRAEDIDGLAGAWTNGGAAGVAALDGGTNGLVLDRGLDWRFAFGPDSFGAHGAVASSLGVRLALVGNRRFSFDLDWPADVQKALTLPLGRHTRATLATASDLDRALDRARSRA